MNSGSCRVCGGSGIWGDKLKSINDVIEGRAQTFKDALKNIIGLEMDSNLKLPQRICINCCNQLSLIVNFSSIAIGYEKALKTFLSIASSDDSSFEPSEIQEATTQNTRLKNHQNFVEEVEEPTFKKPIARVENQTNEPDNPPKKLRLETILETRERSMSGSSQKVRKHQVNELNASNSQQRKPRLEPILKTTERSIDDSLLSNLPFKNTHDRGMITSFIKSETSRADHQAFHDNHAFQCTICEKSLSGLKKLNLHMKIMHGDKKDLKYQCEKCEYATHKKQRMERHRKAHEKYEEKLKSRSDLCICEKCPALLTTKSNLKIHYESVHGIQIECDRCRKN